MAKLLSAQAKVAAQARETDEVFLVLIEIMHTDWATPFYMVDNTENITSLGNEHIAWPFELTLGDDDGERLPEVKLVIDNVDRQLVEIIRTTREPPVLKVKLVLASQPDVVEVEISDLTLNNVEYDAFTVTWTLLAESLADTRFPSHNISLASGYLGLFRV